MTADAMDDTPSDTGADYTADDPSAVQPEPKQSGAEMIAALLQIPNLATHLDEEKLAEIASKVIEEYQIDRDSRKDWEGRTKDAMDLAMLVAEEKDYPFKKAANVKFPLITTAALQFNARAYPAIVSGDRVVKANIEGKDDDGQKAARGERIASHMSAQNLDDLPEWEDDTDKLLVILPIVGCAFRKRFYDNGLGRQVTRLISASNLVVNYFARSLEDAPRVTERLYLYPYEIQERIRNGRFVEFDYANATAAADDNPAGTDGDDGDDADADDDDAPQLFLEQHRLLDLDGDGYPEPYIVTVHRGAEKVCRIVANFSTDTVKVDAQGEITAIRKQQFYVRYLFLPSPDGGFYGMGLGTLLKSNNEAINSTLNLMLDSGHLSNIQGGFISSALGIREKNIVMEPAKWKVLNTGAGKLGDSIFPFTYPGPSETLFKLLGFLVDMGKDLASIKDVLTGDSGGKVLQPTAIMALIDQGLKVFTAIFKRIHRSLKKELLLQADLNARYLTADEYNRFLDDKTQQFDPKADYDMSSMDVIPVSDPNMTTKMQKLANAQFVAEVSKENPAVNPIEALKYQFEAAEIPPDVIERLIPKPDPAVEQLKQRDAEATVKLKEAQVENLHAQSGAALAQADQAEAHAQAELRGQNADLTGQMATMKANQDAAAAAHKNELEQMKLHMTAAIADAKQGADVLKAAWSNLTSIEIARIGASADTDPAAGPVESALEEVVGVTGKRAQENSQFTATMGGMMDAFRQMTAALMQQGQQTQQSVDNLSQLVAAPNELVRDENGRPTGSRKVLN